MFISYLELGLEHILDVKAYDHVLFVIVLCVAYQIVEWKKILILITAFTLGHSLSLALSVLNIMTVPKDLIEFLIPVTIIIAALANIFATQRSRGTYALALFFGTIHGFGFSNYLKAILGQEDELVIPLLAFNLGVEAGQLLVVIATICVTYLIINYARVAQRDWRMVVSSVVLGMALSLMFM